MRHAVGRLASMGCFALMVAAAGPVQGQGFKWWQSDKVKQDLALTAEQSSRLEDVFQAALPRLRQTKDELDRLEADLSRLIESNTDEIQIARQIDRVETARSALNKWRTLMLVHMRQVLTPDQRTRLNKLFDERGHGKADDAGQRRP